VGLQATRLPSGTSGFHETKKENKMSKILGSFLALALLVGASAAYAWDQQATDEQMGYSLNYRAAPGTPNSYLGEVPTR
jgi:hypothetical protein